MRSTTITATLLLLLTSAALAQQRNPARNDADPFAPAPPFNAPGAAAGQAMQDAMVQVHILKGWIDLVDSYTRLAKDPTAAGVAAVVTANDMLKHKGTEVAIEYFTKLMSEVKNESVQRAIRLQLVELYGKAGQPDQALEQLRMLMILAPKESAKE